MDESEFLLEQLANGDSSIWEALFDHHREFLLRVIEVRLDSRLAARVGASDILQETYVELFRRMDDFLARRPMSLRVWMRMTACERLIEARRRHLGAQVRTATREVRLPEQSSFFSAQNAMAASDLSPSRVVSDAELAKNVQHAIRQLTEDDQEVLLLRTYEGLTNAETSEVLGIGQDAARKRYGRALIRLRRRLQTDSFHDGPNE